MMSKNRLFGLLLLTALTFVTFLPVISKGESFRQARARVTTISGAISRDTIWSGNILVTEKATVSEGVTLTVEPGTVVKFKHWRPGYTDPFRRIQLDVKGTLRAVGTPEKPIRFTSDAPKPEHSDWMGINIGPSLGNSIIDHCIVEFGRGGICTESANITLSNSILRWCQGANVWLHQGSATITRNRIYGAGHGGIEMADSNITLTYNTIWDNGLGIVPISTSNLFIRHNAIVDNRFTGILIGSLSKAVVEYNNITGNAHEGIKIFKSSNSSIRYNNIHDNGEWQLFIEEASATAIENWWGTTNETEVASGIGIHQERGGTVLYEPYLTSPADIPEIAYDYVNTETYEHPPATEKDTFPYFSPSDETRKVVTSWSTINNPTGIAWDGQYFWVVELHKRLLKYDSSGKLVDSLTAPGSLPVALAYDGQYFWSLDFSDRLAYQFDFSGRVVKSIPAPVGGYGEGGLAYDGQYLWTAQGNKLYRIDTSGNVVNVTQIQIDWCSIAGLAWDGEHLWAADKDVNDRIFEIDPSSGSILRWINTLGDETWGMTWVEGYLWACEWTNDWNNYIIVKMEPAKATTHNYDGLWHKTDFTITLTAFDDVSGVNQTCYRINGGPIRIVSIDGQPRITTESSNNTLEYWSVDNTGHEEQPHKMLTEIKLDKTPPTVEVPSRTPDGDVQPDQEVKISANISDLTSNVKNATLQYTLNDGATWSDLDMTHNSTTDLYETTIPGQLEGTVVRFRMYVYDNAGNNVTKNGSEPYCVYTVIPEFSSIIILLLSMVACAFVGVYRSRKTRKRVVPFL